MTNRRKPLLDAVAALDGRTGDLSLFLGADDGDVFWAAEDGPELPLSVGQVEEDGGPRSLCVCTAGAARFLAAALLRYASKCEAGKE